MNPLWAIRIIVCKDEEEIDTVEVIDPKLDEVIESIHKWLEVLYANRDRRL